MGGEKRRKLAASETPWDDVDAAELTPAQLLVRDSHRSIYSFRHEAHEGDVAFFNGYERESCPFCGGELVRFGHDRSGLQRYRCTSCRKTSTPVTGTIFEDRKLPLSAWTDFLAQTFSYASMSLMTWEDRRSDTTIPYWMAKLFSVLEGVQDDVVLSGTVWLDETYVSEVAGKLWHRPDGKLPRGLSRNKICIAVGVDSGGRSIFVNEGKGITTTARTWAALGAKIEPGSHVIHDMETAHNKLVKELKLVSETHNGKALMGVPDKQNPLRPVNHMCFLLKEFLRSHSGFDREDLDGWLDVFFVTMNEPEDKLEKAAMVLDRAMRCPKTLRFREFYNVRPSSRGSD